MSSARVARLAGPIRGAIAEPGLRSASTTRPYLLTTRSAPPHRPHLPRRSRRTVPLLPALEGGILATRIGWCVNAVVCEALVCRGQIGLTALRQLRCRRHTGRREEAMAPLLVISTD